MIINTNVAALKAVNGLWHRNNALAQSSERLSMGTKINKSGDDPAGLAISNKMRAQIKGLEVADRNTNDAVSLIQTAESGVSAIGDMVQRMRELAVQASTDALTDSDRQNLQIEIESLMEEIEAVTDKIEFNQKSLLNDDYEEFTFQIGSREGQEVTLSLKNIDLEYLDLQDLDITSIEGAEDVLERADRAISVITQYRTNLGVMQNRLETNSESLAVSEEATRTALSRIMDTDMAKEMAEYTKNNILVQSGIAMLSQANQRPNQLLNLLQ